MTDTKLTDLVDELFRTAEHSGWQFATNRDYKDALEAQDELIAYIANNYTKKETK